MQGRKKMSNTNGMTLAIVACARNSISSHTNEPQGSVRKEDLGAFESNGASASAMALLPKKAIHTVLVAEDMRSAETAVALVLKWSGRFKCQDQPVKFKTDKAMNPPVVRPNFDIHKLFATKTTHDERAAEVLRCLEQDGLYREAYLHKAILYYGMLQDLANTHTSETFLVCCDPLTASILAEVARNGVGENWSPGFLVERLMRPCDIQIIKVTTK